MAKRKRVKAIFTVSNVVSQFMSDANALKESLTTAPGNTYVTIPPADITAFEGHMVTLVDDEATAQSGEDGTAAARDLSWDVVKTDVLGFVTAVQTRVNAEIDYATAVAIVLACGLRTRQVTPRPNPEIEVRNDKTVPGLVHLISKAAGRGLKAAYEWEWSTNGTTFTRAKIALNCRDTWTTTVAPGTKLYFRKRVNTNKDIGTPAWSQIVSLIIN